MLRAEEPDMPLYLATRRRDSGAPGESSLCSVLGVEDLDELVERMEAEEDDADHST